MGRLPLQDSTAIVLQRKISGTNCSDAMALFPRWTNTVARLSLAGLFATPLLAITFLLVWVRTPFITHERIEVAQPVQFDHRHHSWENGIDCRFCHTSVETSPYAGMPPTDRCIGCHGQVWNKSPRLAPVRQAFFTARPIPWVKVHALPDFVYFDHSIHVNKGVGCVTCHGRVDQMPAVYQHAPLMMSWCLDCHRNPAPHLRPKSEITNMLWSARRSGEGERRSERSGLNLAESLPGPDAELYASLEPGELSKRLVQDYDVHPRTSCETCHR
jgi:hypothetical protein